MKRLYSCAMASSEKNRFQYESIKTGLLFSFSQQILQSDWSSLLKSAEIDDFGTKFSTGRFGRNIQSNVLQP
jgi:hypothetical protein